MKSKQDPSGAPVAGTGSLEEFEELNEDQANEIIKKQEEKQARKKEEDKRRQEKNTKPRKTLGAKRKRKI